MVTRDDYMQDAVEAARSVSLELMRMLGAYREHLLLIGGWVPEFLLPNAEPRHTGSLDIDLALNHRTMPESGSRIRQLHARMGVKDRLAFRTRPASQRRDGA